MLHAAVQVFAEDLGGLRKLLRGVCCGKGGKPEVVPGLGSLKDLRCIEEQVGDIQLLVKQGNRSFKVRSLSVSGGMKCTEISANIRFFDFLYYCVYIYYV